MTRPSDATAAEDGLHVVVLTLNEERHIERCLRSVRPVAQSLTVVDCGSGDRTVELARALGAEVLHHPFVNHAAQLDFAVDALAGAGGWLFRIDADEVLEPPAAGLTDFLQRQPESVAGVALARRIHFMGRRIRFGGIEPNWQLRIWRNGRGRCEARWMDEHVRVAGAVVRSPFVVSDINLNSLTRWIDKHNSYASREAIEVLNQRHHLFAAAAEAGATSPGARTKRLLKTTLYHRLPPGLRALVYFLLRYVVRLGFLDGRAGFFFHLFQGLWYRSLVDAKVIEISAHAAAAGVPIPEAIRDRTGIDIAATAEREGSEA